MKNPEDLYISQLAVTEDIDLHPGDMVLLKSKNYFAFTRELLDFREPIVWSGWVDKFWRLSGKEVKIQSQDEAPLADVPLFRINLEYTPLQFNYAYSLDMFDKEGFKYLSKHKGNNPSLKTQSKIQLKAYIKNLKKLKNEK